VQVNDNLVATLTIPGIEAYRKYGLVISPVGERLLVLESATELESAIVVPDAVPLPVGPYLPTQTLHLRLGTHLGAPITVYVTPFASLTGELDHLPYSAGDVDNVGMLLAVLAAIANVDAHVANVDADVVAVAAQITNLDGDVVAIGVDVGTIQVDIGTIQADIGTIQADIGTIQIDVGTIQADIGTIQADIADIEADLALFKASAMGFVYELEVPITCPANNVGAVTLATVQVQRARILAVTIMADAAVTANLTSFVVSAGTGGVITVIPVTLRADVADVDQQVTDEGGSGGFVLPVNGTITFTPTGIAATALTLRAVIRWSPVVAGATLT
jgi:hypothetical protein